MGFKKNFKKIMSATIVGTMLLSMVGCEFGPMTTEKLLTKMEENALINDAVVEQLLSDDVITGEELEVIVNNVKSSKGNVSVDFIGGVEMSMEGMSQSVDVEAALTGGYKYDSKTKSIMGDMNIEASAMGEEFDESMSFYLINEDGTYYGYTQENDDVAMREELGDESELWEDIEISVDDMLYELDLDSKEELVDMFKTSSLKEYQDDLVLSKNKVEFEGRKCYELIYHFDGNTILEELEKNDEVADIFEDEMGMTVDEFLEEELTDGYTASDLLKDINFDVTYYVDAENFYISYIELDLKPTIDKLGESIIDIAMAEMGTEYEDAKIELNIEKASISVTYVEDEDISVKFKGEYEEY